MVWRLFICSLITVLLGALGALADTLVVAGHPQVLGSPLILEGDDVLAPVTPALRLLGASSSMAGSSLTITTADRRVLKLTAGSTRMQVDSNKVTLAAAPRKVDDELYLPARALASWLQTDVRFEPATRTLTLLPLVTATYEARPEGTAVLIRSSAPLQYSSGRLTDPPRLYFDFRNVSLGLTEQQLPVDLGLVQRLRISQYSTAPDVVRVVVDLGDNAGVATTVGEQGRLVTIAISNTPVEVTPPPTLPEQVPSGPYKLLGLALTPQAGQLTELSVDSDGPVAFDSAYASATRQLTLTFPNGLNHIPNEQLAALKDKVVSKLEVVGTAATPGVKLVATLKQDAGYLVERDATRIRVLIGVFSIGDMTIVLDAGHGGHDTGAVGRNRTCEKDVNLDVVLRTAKLLKNAGARVLLTRSDDTFITLDNRPGLANSKNADLFISVHCNSSAKYNSGSGTQTYYKTPQSLDLAKAMHVEMIKGMGLKDGGVRNASFLVIRKSRMPAVLLEIAFINNEREEALLCSTDFRQKVAESIVNGIRRYATSKSWTMRRLELPLILAAPANPEPITAPPMPDEAQAAP